MSVADGILIGGIIGALGMTLLGVALLALDIQRRATPCRDVFKPKIIPRVPAKAE